MNRLNQSKKTQLFNRYALALALLTLPTIAEAQLPKGVVETRPTTGPTVETDRGWMVPYRERIPGTDFTFRMIPIAGGTFAMGSSPEEAGARADELPQVWIKVAPMWVGQCEVTQREYEQYQQVYTVFKEIERDDPDYSKLDRSRVDVVTAPTAVYDPSYQFEYGDSVKHPAVSMTRYAAKQYTKWLSILTQQQYRLPTEAEWEYACRAGSKTRFNWGDEKGDADQYASYLGNAESLSHVGSKLPNAFGLYDMHGNAGEWTINAYTTNGYRWLKKHEPVDATNAVRWPKGSDYGVVRGGSIHSDVSEIRCASRQIAKEEDWKDQDASSPKSPWWYTSDPARTVGFRLFRSATPLKAALISKFWDHTSEDTEHAVRTKLMEGRGAVGIVDKEVQNALRKATKKTVRNK